MVILLGIPCMYLELSLGLVTQGGPIKIGLALSHSALKIIIETK